MRVRAMLVAVALLLVGPGCWGQAPSAGLRPAVPTTTTPDGSVGPADVVLFSDSLGAFGESLIVPIWLAQAPGVSISYNAEAGAEAVNWLPWMAQVSSDQCVIYALGSNEISRLTALEAEWQTLGAFNELADVKKVVVLNLNTTSHDLRGTPFSSRARHFNSFLQQLYIDGTYPNLHVLDWNAISLGHPEWLTADKLHLNEMGMVEYGETFVQAQEWC